MQKHTHLSLYASTQHRATVFSLFGVLLALCILLTACAENNATAPDSKQLLQQAQEAMKQVKSYHFNLTTDKPGSGNGIEIQKADGEVLAPDKIQAKGTTSLSGITAQVSIIAIGKEQYYTDPITGQWVQASGSVVDPQKLADPEAGIGAMLGNIREPGKATDSPGNNCWSITGHLSTAYVAGVVIGTSKPGNEDVETTVCIGKSDHRLYQVQINGIVIQSDSVQTKRTVKFSKFNDPVTIEAPRV